MAFGDWAAIAAMSSWEALLRVTDDGEGFVWGLGKAVLHKTERKREEEEMRLESHLWGQRIDGMLLIIFD